MERIEVFHLHGFINEEGAFYAKGHVSKEEFAKACQEQWMWKCADPAPAEKIDHVYARLIPRQGREYDMEFVTYEHPKRGAFACTFWECGS